MFENPENKCLTHRRYFLWKLSNLQIISLKLGILDQIETKGCHNLEWMPVLCQIVPLVNKQGMMATEQQYN